MASVPPRVQWMEESEDGTALNAATLWDAGIVQAGDTSAPHIFYVWNNRGGTSDVADMINTKISVRDSTGNYIDGDVAKQERAIVKAQMFDQSRASGQGQWGSFNASGKWTSDTYIDLFWNNARDIIQMSGKKIGDISGKANNGNWKNDDTNGIIADADNFAKLKLVLEAKSDADAGSISWRTRISYQYV